MEISDTDPYQVVRGLKSENQNLRKEIILQLKINKLKLEPIIQSEVSQKEKHQYSIVMHIYGI